MRRITVLVGVALLLLCFSFTINAHAQTSIGVSTGNSFKYDFSAHFSSLNASEPVPQQLIRDNKTQWLRFTVTSISNTTVNYTLIQHLANGTEITLTDQTDVATGEGGFTIVRANLGVNDPLFPTAASPAIVNETITRTYNQGPRQINHASWNETDYLDLYFDKQTGVPVEFHIAFTATPDSTAEYVYILTDSNIWAVPEFPTLLVPVILVTAVTIAAVLYKKNKPTQKTTFPTNATGTFLKSVRTVTQQKS